MAQSPAMPADSAGAVSTVKAETVVLRKAVTSDVPAIHRIVNGYAEQGLMLARSLSALYETVRDFTVVEEDGEVVGCIALHVSWKELAEIKSLAVAESHQRRGLARRLIEASLREAPVLGVHEVFALTYVPELFEKIGFHRLDKAMLPRKVWTECIYCPQFAECGEVAVMRDLEAAPLSPS